MRPPMASRACSCSFVRLLPLAPAVRSSDRGGGDISEERAARLAASSLRAERSFVLRAPLPPPQWRASQRMMVIKTPQQQQGRDHGSFSARRVPETGCAIGRAGALLQPHRGVPCAVAWRP